MQYNIVETIDMPILFKGVEGQIIKKKLKEYTALVSSNNRDYNNL